MPSVSNADHFVPDSTVFLRLQHMADRCRAEGATLVFVEYPTHPDVQEIDGAPAIAPIREAYFEQLARIAPLIDLDRPECSQPIELLARPATPDR